MSPRIAERDEIMRAGTTQRRATMRAAVFVSPGGLEVRDVPRLMAAPGEAISRVIPTTICGTAVAGHRSS